MAGASCPDDLHSGRNRVLAQGKSVSLTRLFTVGLCAVLNRPPHIGSLGLWNGPLNLQKLDAMDQNKTTPERAFELAESGVHRLGAFVGGPSRVGPRCSPATDHQAENLLRQPPSLRGFLFCLSR